MAEDKSFWSDKVECYACAAFVEIQTQVEDSWPIAEKAALGAGFVKRADYWVCPECFEIAKKIIWERGRSK